MNPTPLSRLVRRARSHIWAGILLRLLWRALWAGALILALGGVLRWRLGTPDLTSLALLASLPFVLSIAAGLRRRPARETAAAAADRWLKADALLMSAWHIEKDAAGGPAAAPLVVAQARRSLPAWEAGIRALWPALRTGNLVPPLLAMMAALPLLALESIPETPLPERLSPGSDVSVIPEARGSALSELVAELKTTARPPAPEKAPAARTSLAGAAPQTSSQRGDARPTAGDTSGAHSHTGVGAHAGMPMPAQVTDVSGEAPNPGNTWAQGAGGGRDSVGTDEAVTSRSHQQGSDPANLPEHLNAIERTGMPRSSTHGSGDDLVARPDRIGAVAGPAASPAEAPSDLERDLAARGPARRALVARYFQFSQQRITND